MRYIRAQIGEYTFLYQPVINPDTPAVIVLQLEKVLAAYADDNPADTIAESEKQL